MGNEERGLLDRVAEPMVMSLPNRDKSTARGEMQSKGVEVGFKHIRLEDL